MAFRYSLSTVLRLRESLERQEEQRLLGEAAAVQRLRAEIERLDADHLQRQRATFAHLSQGSVAAELQFATACTAGYERTRDQLQAELQAAEARRLQRLKAYRLARQKREILDSLCYRQEAAYALESARREQQNADELHLLRGCRGRDDHILPSATAESA